MNSHHESFFDRPEGLPFRDVVERPEIVAQYELLSRIELPAVQAIVWDLDPLLERLDAKSRPFAVQSTGALIADLLAHRGFRVARDPRGVNRRGRVRKSRFVRTGSIFERVPVPARARDDDVRRIVDDLMVTYRSTLEALAK